MVRKQKKKIDRGNKTLPDIILKAVRAVKIHNFHIYHLIYISIRQAALDFNINYCPLSHALSNYCKISLNI